jgi:glycosyltransferase involved in cell wall biosynthesis
MKIGILGTRGIPNQYGGFEQFAQFLSLYLVNNGHQVWVYNSSQHNFQEKKYKGVSIIHCFDPEYKIGTIGQFIYDFNCIRDARKRDFDILLQLGYTSSSVWASLLPKEQVIITNMDGLEWKRTKFRKPVQRFLRNAEKWAVRSSDHLVADSKGIQEYLNEKYKCTSTYIPYGAEVFNTPNSACLVDFNLKEGEYDMLIARLEPENSIEMILEGRAMADTKRDLIVIGNYETTFGLYLRNKFQHETGIRFLGGVYDQDLLNNLRHYSNIYFHGHQVGGTNPSLLEAMGAGALVAAHRNVFNKAILKENGFYFLSASDVKDCIDFALKSDNLPRIEANKEVIRKEFTWDKINKAYEDLFKKVISRS